MGAVYIWHDTVTYDKLTINERQKTHQKFSEMLDQVRRGFQMIRPSLHLLKEYFRCPLKKFTV
uniref:Uncharacterized protein n=1 Tax=Amphimedon queenslandica TaxID=400682 RepID=A0A1X7VPU9_AMPQE